MSTRPTRTQTNVIVSNRSFESPHARALWLFEFLRTDLAQVGNDQLKHLRTGVTDFIDSSPGGVALESSTHDERLRLPRRTVQALITAVLDGIHRLQAGQHWRLPNRVGYGLARWHDTIRTSHTEGTLTTLFIASAMAIVQESWSRLHRCPQCDAIFLKVGKQRYCAPACSQQFRWTKFAQSKKRTRNYRREREEAIKKQYGPKVRLSGHRKK